jgi:hypothetical protein
MSSSDSISIFSDSDSDFKEFACVNCQHVSMGKTMWFCGQCNGKLCQCCDNRYSGCADDEYNHVCNTCFEVVFHGKVRYCNDKECTHCLNKSPQFKAKQSRRVDAYYNFVNSVDRSAWRAKHKPIDFKSVHQGKYLIDLYLSGTEFEKGYIDWLIKAGKDTSYQGPRAASFPDFVKEAKELKAASLKLRTQPKRDRSPKRKASEIK